MALMDKIAVFSEEQDLGQTQAAYDSTHTVDKGEGVNEFGSSKIPSEGAGEGADLNVLVTEAFTSSGSATVAVKLQESADDSSWTDTPIAVAATAFDNAALAKGKYIIKQRLPRGLKRYLKLVYTIGGATTTAGAVSAWIGAPATDK